MALVRFHDIHKRFGPLKVLQGISLDITAGKRTAILGPNGSGKTTLIKTLLGMVLPDAGDVFFRDASVLGKYQYRKALVYMPQIAIFPHNLRVRELIALVPRLRQQPARPEPVIERFGVGEFMHKRMNALSGGMKQKVNLVLAFMFDAPLLILDEPTNGLDPLATLELKKLMKEETARGKTILFSSHLMSFVQQLAEHIVFLLEGKIYFQGAPEALLHSTGTDSVEEAVAWLMKRHHTSTQPA